jgi:hypothetical protein
MQVEELHFVKLDGVSYRQDDQVHDLGCDVLAGQEAKVNLKADFVRVILETYAKQLVKLFVSDAIKVDCKEVIGVVLLTVHLENLVDLIFINQEALSEVLGNS